MGIKSRHKIHLCSTYKCIYYINRKKLNIFRILTIIPYKTLGMKFSIWGTVFAENIWDMGPFWVLDYFKMLNPFSHSPSSHRVPLPVMVSLLASEPQFLPFSPQSKDDESFWEIKSHEEVLGSRVKYQPFGGCCLYVHRKLWPVDKERGQELGMLAYNPSSQEQGQEDYKSEVNLGCLDIFRNTAVRYFHK